MELTEKIANIEDQYYQISRFNLEQQGEKFLNEKEYPSIEHIISLPLKAAEIYPIYPTTPNKYLYIYKLSYENGASFINLWFIINVGDHHTTEAIKDYVDGQIITIKREINIDKILNA